MVALTLAAVAAATQRVLLIDADLRRRTLAALDAEAQRRRPGRRRRRTPRTVRCDQDRSRHQHQSHRLRGAGSRRDRRIYDADIKRAFELTRRYDLVIVAAMDHADPSLRFFAGLVDHIVLVAGADGFDETAAERFIARARDRCRQGPRRGADRPHDGMTPDMSRMAKPGFQSSAGRAAQPAVDLDTLVRSVLFLAAFLAAWISFHPFPDLSLPPQSVIEGGDPANQIGFSAMFLAFAAWTYWHEPRRLMLLLRPVLVATVAVVRAQRHHLLGAGACRAPPRLRADRHQHFRDDPFGAEEPAALQRSVGRGGADRAGRRAISACCCCRNMRSTTRPTFSSPSMPANGAACFRTRTMPAPPWCCSSSSASTWRACAVSRSATAIVALAGIFLAFTESKTAIGVLPIALILSGIIGRSRSAALGIGHRRHHALCLRTVFRRHRDLRADAKADAGDHAGRHLHRANRDLAARRAGGGAAAVHRIWLFDLLGHAGSRLRFRRHARPGPMPRPMPTMPISIWR